MDKTGSTEATINTGRPAPHNQLVIEVWDGRPNYCEWHCSCGHDAYATRPTRGWGAFGRRNIFMIARDRHRAHVNRAQAARAAAPMAGPPTDRVVCKNRIQTGPPTYQPIVYSIHELLEEHKFDPGDIVPDPEAIASVLDAAAALGWRPE